MKAGAYETVRLLGRGGMSEVWEAVDPRTGGRRALKVYSYKNENEDVRRRFGVEGSLLAKLGHPGIVKVTDIGETDDGRPYFAMDLVLSPDGEPKSLADVPEGEADEETIGRWYDGIRSALAYVHSKGVVHRDLKLQNVLVGPDGGAVLADFGVSRVSEAEDGGAAVVDTVQTLIGIRDGRKTVMGSVGYMAPEVEMGAPATAKSDWYSLGVIVYKLLTGTWCDSRTDVSAMLETYDPVWRRILPKLLHSNPEGRECLSWAEEKAAENERALAAMEAKYLAEKARGHRTRHAWRYAAGAALAVAAGLGAGLGIARSGLAEAKAETEKMREKVEWVEKRPKPVAFDWLFSIPPEARSEEKTDAEGNVTMPSRGDFALALDDAYLLARPLMAGLHGGRTTFEKAVETLERWRDALLDEDADSPFENVEFGGGPYLQNGDNAPLAMMIEGAIEKLGKLAEQ